MKIKQEVKLLKLIVLEKTEKKKEKLGETGCGITNKPLRKVLKFFILFLLGNFLINFSDYVTEPVGRKRAMCLSL